MITGHIEGAPNMDQPDLGAWRYELTITWDTAVQFAVSHVNVIVDDGTNCECYDFTSAIEWPAPAGFSEGEPMGCTVEYYSVFECYGDPSLDIDNPLFKFEYDEDAGCEPGNTGVAVFTFYSDYPPYDTELPNLFIVDKHGQLSCYGGLTGVFPALPCGPVANEVMNWGLVKSGYGR